MIHFVEPTHDSIAGFPFNQFQFIGSDEGQRMVFLYQLKEVWTSIMAFWLASSKATISRVRLRLAADSGFSSKSESMLSL
jgi:hypothetical protein